MELKSCEICGMILRPGSDDCLNRSCRLVISLRQQLSEVERERDEAIKARDFHINSVDHHVKKARSENEAIWQRCIEICADDYREYEADGKKHQPNTPERDRLFARARAVANIGEAIRAEKEKS